MRGALHSRCIAVRFAATGARAASGSRSKSTTRAANSVSSSARHQRAQLGSRMSRVPMTAVDTTGNAQAMASSSTSPGSRCARRTRRRRRRNSNRAAHCAGPGSRANSTLRLQPQARARRCRCLHATGPRRRAPAARPANARARAPARATGSRCSSRRPPGLRAPGPAVPAAMPWRRRKAAPFPPANRSSSMPVGMISIGRRTPYVRSTSPIAWEGTTTASRSLHCAREKRRASARVQAPGTSGT